MALKAKDGTHWNCEKSDQWDRSMNGLLPNNAFAKGNQSETNLNDSSANNSKAALLIICAVLIGLPILLLIVVLIVNLILKCEYEKEVIELPPDRREDEIQINM